MTTGRNRPKPGQQLKSFFAVGGIVTTLLGANFLANREQAVAATTAPQLVLLDTTQTDNMTSTGNPYLDNNTPIQQLVIPEPVARSRSS